MLTVQMRIGTVEADRRNGSIHSRYHGYTTGAHKSDAAIGQAKPSGEHSGPSPHPDRDKKTGEHCQPGCNLWSRYSFKHRKPRTVKAETLHVDPERAEGNAAVVEKRYIKESENYCCQCAIAQADPFPVERQQYHREQFHRNR